MSFEDCEVSELTQSGLIRAVNSKGLSDLDTRRQSYEVSVKIHDGLAEKIIFLLYDHTFYQKSFNNVLI